MSPPLVVVHAENVRRSTWPNLSKEELVERARRWAEYEDVRSLVVCDGPPPEDAEDLLGSGSRTADDVIVELQGPVSGSSARTATCASESRAAPSG